MTKLDELWVEAAKYQSIADDKGYGKAWAEMCRLRTERACKAASRAAYAAAVVAVDAVCGWFAAAADAAGDAAGHAAASAADADAEYWAQKAIAHINHAIELAEKQND
jgi:hypothetical protein